MKRPILSLIPSAYKTSKVYSVLPVNGDGDFDLIRSSNGTRVQENGLIENKSNNIPRLDWLNSNCPSLLLEPQRTNLALYSENFQGTNWMSGNTVITQNDSIAPSGEKTAVKLQRNSTSASYRTHFIYKSNSVITYTTSVFVKQGEDNYFAMRVQGSSFFSRVDIRFRFDTGLIYYAQAPILSGFTLIDYNVENYPNGWYRIYFTYTSDAYSTLILTFSPRETDGDVTSSDTSSTSFAYVWGVQTEVGGYLTSYIKTTSSTVTRDRDFLLNGGNFDLFNVSELSLFVDVTNFKPDSTSYSYITLTNGVSSPINMVRLDYTQSGILIRWYNNGTNTFSYDINSVITNQRNKVLLSFGNNQVKTYFNGILKNTTSISGIPNGFDSLSFTNRTETGGTFQGKVHDARFYDKVLTEAEAIELTTL